MPAPLDHATDDESDDVRAFDERLAALCADYAAVKAIAAPEQLTVPDVRIPRPNPAAYDALLAGGQS